MLLMSSLAPAAAHGRDHSLAPNAAAAAAAASQATTIITTTTTTTTTTPTPTSNASFLAHMPLSLLGSYLRPQPPTAQSIQSPQPHHHAPAPTNPQQPMTPSHHDASPALSRPVSSSSSAADGKPKKRASRPKTSYLIAKSVQPVKTRPKLHLRPKVLLQLHQVVASQRPKPVYEVIPFSLCSQRSTRRLARTFNTREKLGHNDLLVVKAEAYDSNENDPPSDQDSWASRDVIAVISPGRTEKGVTGPAEICMDDGMSRWDVSQMPNGGYEFNTTDDHGLTLKARWVFKPANSRRLSGMSTASPLSPSFPSGTDDKKFTFSTINPSSRRHPIIATMNSARIEVLDSYMMPSATSPPTPSLATPAMTPSSIHMSSFMDSPDATLPIETDDALRRFIAVSGTWVALQAFAWSDHEPSTSSSHATGARSSKDRSTSYSDSPRSASPASTLDESRRSVPRMFKAATDRLPRSTSLSESSMSAALAKAAPSTSPASKTRSRRANSTGAAQLHSMTGSMRKRYGLAFENQSLLETEEERQSKRSLELLRNKSVSPTSPVTQSPPPPPPLPIEASIPEREPDPLLTALPSPTLSPPSPRPQDPSNPFAPLSAPLTSPPQFSLLLPDPERKRKTQSAFNPITTTGLWDSGVTEGPGLKRRPTSMFVMNERKKKQEKKRDQSKSKEDRKAEKRTSFVDGVVDGNGNENGNTEDQECVGGLKRKGGWYRHKLKLGLKGLLGGRK